jgi:hypothetical protein
VDWVSGRAGFSRRELGEGEGRKCKVGAGGEQVRGQQRQQRQKLREGNPKNVSATRVFCDLLVKQSLSGLFPYATISTVFPYNRGLV